MKSLSQSLQEKINFRINRDSAQNINKSLDLNTFCDGPLFSINVINYPNRKKIQFGIINIEKIINDGSIYKINAEGYRMHAKSVYSGTLFEFKDEKNLVLCDYFKDNLYKENYIIRIFINPTKNNEVIQFLSQFDENKQYSIQDIIYFIGINSSELENYLSDVYDKKYNVSRKEKNNIPEIISILQSTNK